MMSAWTTDADFRYHSIPPYPSAPRLELVKQAGYVACLSAYGGTNIGTVDRYNVLRRSISWEYDDHSFRRLCLGWV